MQVKALHKNVIEAIVITGCARGDILLIPRITLIPTDYPFEFKRIQFPLKVCFAMTINKSQGQSLSMAGIDLREECFSHVQFYVACIRVNSASSFGWNGDRQENFFLIMTQPDDSLISVESCFMSGQPIHT